MRLTLRSLFRFALLPIAAMLWASGSAQELTAETKDAVLKALGEIVTTKAFVAGVDFSKWPEFLEKHKEAIDKATDQPTFTGAINRALREFGFSHFRLLTPTAGAARTQTTTVGIGLRTRKQDDGLAVIDVSLNGPAKEKGLAIGDIITSVDGVAATDVAQLGGAEGTKAKLSIKRKEEVLEIEVERKKFSTVRPETLTWSGEDTAVLKIWTFSTGYDRKNVEKLIAEAAVKAKNLVIDLRSNGGGSTGSMNHLLSLLLPEETAFGTFVSKAIADKFVTETKGDPKDILAIAKWSESKTKTRKPAIPRFTGKVAVLINRGSASASEIVSAALRETLKAPLIGSRSAGAVLASVFGRLPNDFQLQYPITDYVSIGGIRLEGNPLTPDAEVTAPKVDDKDPAVDKAIELLKAAGAG